MRKVLLVLSLSILFLASCGEKKKAETKEVETPKKEEVQPKVEEAAISNDIVVEASDNMRFNVKTITVNGGQKVKITLKHVGKMSKDLMGHNLVIINNDVKMNDFAQKANTAKDTDYIPAEYSANIIAQTIMLGGGEETTIEFDAPAAGTYDFLCTFPAHYAIMKGKFVVK
jgi:azurin